MNRYDTAALIGFISLFSIAGKISSLSFCLLLVCFISVYSGFLKSSGRTCWIVNFNSKREFIRTDSLLPEKEPVIDTETEKKEIYECSIKRTGLSKSVSPKATYIGRSPDQTPRRKVPVRSYRGDRIVHEDRFAVIDAEPVENMPEIIYKEENSNKIEDVSSEIQRETGAEIQVEGQTKTETEAGIQAEIKNNIYNKKGSETTEENIEMAEAEEKETVLVNGPILQYQDSKNTEGKTGSNILLKCTEKIKTPSYEDFPEEGYIDPGLPEI